MDELAEDSIVVGERNYEAALDLVLSQAERELLIFDQDMASGAYSSIRRYEILRAFLAEKGGKATIVLQDGHRFMNTMPRLYALLETYGHRMQVYQTNDSAKVAKDCFVVADQQHYLRRFHIDQARFRYQFNAVETAHMLNMRFVELMEATSHQITVTTLGL